MLGTAEGKQFKKLLVSESERLGLAGIAFSPDGKTLAVSGEDGFVSLVAVPSGKKLWRKQYKSPTSLYTSRLAFSPDGQLLALGSGEDGSISFCHASTGKVIRKIEGHVYDGLSTVTVLAFSPDGRFLASGATDRSLRLWDVASGDQIWAHIKRTGSQTWASVQSICFSEDGRMVGGIGPDYRVWVWETLSGQVRFQFRGDRFLYGGGITQRFGIIPGVARLLAVSPSGKLVAKLTLGKPAKKGAAIPCTLAVWPRSSLSAEPKNVVMPAKANVDLANLVSQLSSRDAAAAYKAILVLAKSEHATPHLNQKIMALKTFFSTRAAVIRKALVDIDSPNFVVRERGTRKLEQIGKQVILRRALQKKPSIEAERRIKSVLKYLDSRPVLKQVLFMHRAMEVLELTASEEAKTVLKEIADTFPKALALEAKASLRRLAR